MATQNSQQYQVFGLDTINFLDKDLLEMLGVKNISLQERENIYRKMLDTIQNRVIAKIDDMIGDDEQKRNKFKQILDSGKHEDIKNFLVNDLKVDIEKIYLEETIIYKTEILALAKAGENNQQ